MNKIKSIGELRDEARLVIPELTAKDAIALLQEPDTVFVDVRDEEERQKHGGIPGALHAARGMLEFLIDPGCPMHDPVFAANKRFVFVCAAGWRSLFAARTAQEMGLGRPHNLSGGIAAWKEAGGPLTGV